MVIRLGGNAAWIGGDPRYGLAVIVWAEGAPPTANAVCAFLTADGLLPATSPQRTQLVFAPTGRVNITTVSRLSHVEVYQYGGGLIASPCELVGAPVVATGTVRATLHQTGSLDNAVAIPGAFEFHMTITGVVDLVGGGQARLPAMEHIVERPDGTLVMSEAPVQLIPR